MNPLRDTEPVKTFKNRKDAFEYAYLFMKRGKFVTMKRSKGLWSVRVMRG